MGNLYRSSDEKVIAGVCAGLAAHSDLEVIFCCFSAGDKAVYEDLLK